MRPVVLVAITSFALGCSSGLANLEREVQELRVRVDDVGRTGRAIQSRLDDLENRILLVQDEVDTRRLTVMRDNALGRTPQLPTVRLVPESRERPPQESSIPPAPVRDESRRTVAASEVLADSYQQIDESGRVVTSRSSRSRPATASDLPVKKLRPPASRSVGEATDDSAILAEYRQAYDLYQQGRAQDAQDAFEEFARNHPRHPYADNARYWVGECLYDRRDWAGARREFLRVINEHPDGNKVPDAMVKVGLSSQRLQQVEEARTMYDAVLLTYPDSEAAAVAMRLLGELP
jgi:tol-pal system protein YbgF